MGTAGGELYDGQYVKEGLQASCIECLPLHRRRSRVYATNPCSYLPVKRLEMHLARSPVRRWTDGARSGRYPPREGVRSSRPSAHAREPHRRRRGRRGDGIVGMSADRPLTVPPIHFQPRHNGPAGGSLPVYNPILETHQRTTRNFGTFWW